MRDRCRNRQADYCAFEEKNKQFGEIDRNFRAEDKPADFRQVNQLRDGNNCHDKFCHRACDCACREHRRRKHIREADDHCF